MLYVKVVRAQNRIIFDVNIPTIIHNNPEFLDGIYPVMISYKRNQMVLTSKMVRNESIGKTGEIFISDPHRKILRIAVGDQISIEHYKQVCTITSLKLLEVDITIRNIPGTSMERIRLSKDKLKQLIQHQWEGLCINNGATYAVDDIETGRFILLNMSICGDNNTICYYENHPISINNIVLENNVKTKCVVLDETSTKSMDMLRSLDLTGLGIGGLKNQIYELLRRVFATRACNADMIEALNISHVKGVLLYGPPGTGKTLIARQLGKMLDSVPPIIVNGPEIMSKYVGESAENIRRLFSEAEKEYNDKGESSRLHVVIFDEFDAIAGQRTSSDSTGAQVGNQIVNQLLSKMDGVDSLNNILIFGLTNRRELIDSALLRPGRFEVQLEIGVPSERGRKEIFDIHLKSAREKGALSANVDTNKLAKETDNFTGAEIAGVIRNATTFAICRQINESDSKDFKLQKSNAICIYPNDLHQAIKDTDPLFGKDNRVLDSILPSDIELRKIQQHAFDTMMAKINDYIKDEKDYSNQSLKLLLTGKIRAGKSTLAVYLAKQCNIANIIYLSYFDMIGVNDYIKNSKLKDLFIKATTTEKSIVILDDIDNLMEMSDTKRGFIFNNGVLQTLSALWSKAITNRIIFITTAQHRQLIADLGLLELFHHCVAL